MKIANSKDGFHRLMEVVQRYGDPVHVAFEPTADYHRNLAYWLQNAGATYFLVSSLISARARELLFKTWDKNDRKDAQCQWFPTNAMLSPVGPILDPVYIMVSTPH